MNPPPSTVPSTAAPKADPIGVPQPLECLQGNPIPPFLSKMFDLVGAVDDFEGDLGYSLASGFINDRLMETKRRKENKVLLGNVKQVRKFVVKRVYKEGLKGLSRQTV
ncbi:hypothetical protein SLA2020_121130 [Shorea laevis]